MQKNWNILAPPHKELFNKYPNLHWVVLQLLYNRGVIQQNQQQQIKDFLNPDFKNRYDPFLLKDMEDAVDLIVDHIKTQKKILIYGDYDADGITSVALLSNILKKLHAQADVYIPDRVSEGYGLNNKAIDGFVAKGVDLIITVDTGIKNKEEVEYAQSLGIKVLVTDHHIPAEEELSNCLIINPHMGYENYPYKYLAGVGVVFKLISALISKTKLSADDKKTLLKSGLDLVAIGTVADCVPLRDENRILVNEGLKILNNTKRLGLQALIEASGLNNKNKKLESGSIGFQLAPRLNASGRLGGTEDVVDLLLTRDKKEATKIAQNLNQKNTQRQKMTQDIVYSIEASLEFEEWGSEKIIIAVNHYSGEWSEGVVGLVAGKICEKYYKPTLVITKAGDKYKGSGRSIQEFNIIEAISGCSDVLEKYGGHAAACGFSLSDYNWESFNQKMKKIAKKELKGMDLKPKLNIDTEVNINDIDYNFVQELSKMAPFGEENPIPVFVSKNVLIKDIVIMGTDGRHIKFRFNGYWALAFGKAEALNNFKIGDKVDIVYSVEFNNFNNNTEVQMKLWDIREAISKIQ